MNQALEKLASDLQDIRRMEREKTTADISDIASVHVAPYAPSPAAKKFDTELTDYNRKAKDVFFGEIR